MSAAPSYTAFSAVYMGPHGQARSRSGSPRLRGRVALRASAPEGWDEANRPHPESPVGDTLPEAFLHNSQRMGDAVAAADDISGVLNYGTYLIGVLLFADFIRDNPRYIKGGRIGVMIPASAGFGVVAMGVLLAGCSLVMINWTAGGANIEFMIAVSGITTVLTSKKFMDKVGKTADLSVLQERDMLLYTEDIKENAYGGFGPLNKLKAAILSKLPQSLLKTWYKLGQLHKESDAVVLFTSGSEAKPKGVILSHGNVLSNIRSVTPVVVKDDDCLMGVLPPFHAFGFTVTSMLPLVTGTKAAYFANPLEFKMVARQIGKWRPTVYIGTPTFTMGMLKASTSDFRKQQKQAEGVSGSYLTSSLRTAITGAEKTPDEAFELAKQQGLTILEGYGVTECSPVLTVNREEKPRAGVGNAIPNICLAIASEAKYQKGETEVIAVADSAGATYGNGVGMRGVVLARGSSIFGNPTATPPRAYLGLPLSEKNPFVEVRKLPIGAEVVASPGWWYDTGDLGYLDESGALVLAGRLKRFVKVGGEMLSLPALEEALKRRTLSDGSQPWADKDGGAVVAIEAYEVDGQKPVLGFVTAVDASLEDANDQLKFEGFTNLARLKVKVDSREAFDAKWAERGCLPLLGSGKADYAQMKAAVKAAALASIVIA